MSSFFFIKYVAKKFVLKQKTKMESKQKNWEFISHDLLQPHKKLLLYTDLGYPPPRTACPPSPRLIKKNSTKYWVWSCSQKKKQLFSFYKKWPLVMCSSGPLISVLAFFFCLCLSKNSCVIFFGSHWDTI